METYFHCISQQLRFVQKCCLHKVVYVFYLESSAIFVTMHDLQIKLISLDLRVEQTPG